MANRTHSKKPNKNRMLGSLIGILSTLALGCSTGTFASNESTISNQNDLPPPVSIPVAIRQDVLPYVANEGKSGLEIDLVDAIFAQTPYAPDYIQLPRMRMIQTFNARGVEGIITSNTALAGKGCITDWYIKHQNVGVTLAERALAINSLSDVANLSIITFDGATRFLGPQFAQQAKNSPRYIESPDQNIHVSLVYFGYFDAAIGDEWILKLAQVNQKRKTGAFQPLTVHRILPTTYYSARFHQQAVCDAFDKGLATIRESGRYDEIVRDHFDRISAQIEVYENEIAMSDQPSGGNR